MIKAIIVEDDPMVAEINRRYLSEFQDIEVASLFRNGRDALNFVLGNEVDLIILDITMPVLDGLEFVKLIREKRINCDIIVVTAAIVLAVSSRLFDTRHWPAVLVPQAAHNNNPLY